MTIKQGYASLVEFPQLLEQHMREWNAKQLKKYTVGPKDTRKKKFFYTQVERKRVCWYIYTYSIYTARLFYFILNA